MLVLKTISPYRSPVAPKALPSKTRPSSRAITAFTSLFWVDISLPLFDQKKTPVQGVSFDLTNFSRANFFHTFFYHTSRAESIIFLSYHCPSEVDVLKFFFYFIREQCRLWPMKTSPS